MSDTKKDYKRREASVDSGVGVSCLARFMSSTSTGKQKEN